MYTIKVCEVGYQLVVGIQMLILTLTDNGTANIWINNYQLTDNCTANIWITNYQLTDNCTANIWINNYQLTDNGTANIWINSYQLTDNCTANSWINNYQLTANFTVLQYDNPETTQHFESVRTSKNWFWIWTRLDHDETSNPLLPRHKWSFIYFWIDVCTAYWKKVHSPD